MPITCVCRSGRLLSDADGRTVTAVSDEETVPEPNQETLNIVRAELDIEREAQDQRSASADTRAGLVVGFSGVMASIAVNSRSLLTLPGLGLAVVAAVLATTVLWPRLQRTVNPRALRNRYLAGAPDLIKLAVLDRRILDYEENQEQIKIKVARLKRAIAVFVVAVASLLLGQATTLILGTFAPKPAAATMLRPSPGVHADDCTRADARANGRCCARDARANTGPRSADGAVSSGPLDHRPC